MAESAKQTTVGGLRAVELFYRVIREISGGTSVAFQSQTRLNAPQLGVMTPDKYRDVCEMTNQAVRLFELEMIQSLEATLKFTERELNFQWISVYMPVRALKEDGIEKELLSRCARFEVPVNKVCFALSEKLLSEEDGQAAEMIGKLRNRGFHFMLTDFGASTCPMMRLSNFPVDYVMLSPEVSNYIGKGERSDSAVQSIIHFVNDMNAEPIADGVFNSRQAELLYTFECTYCAGALAGKYMAEKYVRRKTD